MKKFDYVIIAAVAIMSIALFVFVWSGGLEKVQSLMTETNNTEQANDETSTSDEELDIIDDTAEDDEIIEHENNAEMYVNINARGVDVAQMRFGEEYYEEYIYENGTEINRIISDHGTVYMDYATCPDQNCTHMWPLTDSGRLIVCLPHQVVIEVRTDGTYFPPEVDDIG